MYQRMEFNHDKVEPVVEKDRLSTLPDDLIHKILSSFDMKFVVRTCLLSTRWKLLWTSMPYLNFSADRFPNLQKFDKFATHVLCHRNHQLEVFLVKLHSGGTLDQVFVEMIASYALSHNVQELDLGCSVNVMNSRLKSYPPFLFSSWCLKHLTMSLTYMRLFDRTKTPWDFPALTTLNLSHIRLCGDIFSKCVNLKSLTLDHFRVVGLEEAFDIITPRLSSLSLSSGHCSKVMNVITPQLEKLILFCCSIKYLNAPPEVISLCYTSWPCSYGSVEFSNDPFHSLNKVILALHYKDKTCTEKDAREVINMLQKLRSARYLTLYEDIVEGISAFPDLLSQHSSPFSNLICLTIDSYKVGYIVKMSNEARNFFLDNSPSATLIMKSPNQGSK